VDIFDGHSGILLRRWGADLFAMPHGLTIDDHDNVWLTDVALQQVYKFSPDGQMLLTLGERGVAGADARHFNALLLLPNRRRKVPHKNAPTKRWLQLEGHSHRWIWRTNSCSRFQAISRDLLTRVDVLGHPRTSLDGGPWAIQAVPPILIRIKLK
jgi:hypothetical protein